GDIDAVAHEVAVALFDDVADMDPDAVLYAFFGRQADVAFGHAELNIDHAAELDKHTVAGALDHPAAVNGDCRVDEVAAQRAQSSQNPFFVGTGEPAVTDDVGGQDRREFSALGHVSA